MIDTANTISNLPPLHFRMLLLLLVVVRVSPRMMLMSPLRLLKPRS
jgi:hypothetical protein